MFPTISKEENDHLSNTLCTIWKWLNLTQSNILLRGKELMESCFEMKLVLNESFSLCNVFKQYLLQKCEKLQVDS